MKNRALLIIDVQNDYFTGGKMVLPGAEQAAENISRILERFRANDLQVVHVRHHSQGEGASFFIPETPGAGFFKSVQPVTGEEVITKNFPNSFKQTELQEYLKGQGITELVITGMMAFMCVDATVRAARDLDYSCTLVHDCTATPPTEFGGIACSSEQAKSVIMAALSYLSVRVVATEQILDEL
ncbi:cysteine hydrolase family protein [Desulfosediminicola ganghwensis]|uniref:cysteine hydrolase family protein n=1 Tax=Desulfosediminicola ganghwensis TaxID=2569540 RepID=UPI0010AD1F81|nr:cysteine hydrolase family protein [Desulfosediminicola ganghwensis]